MNTITPLMRAMLEALDTNERGMTEPVLSLTVAYMGHREGADTEQRALRDLAALGLVSIRPHREPPDVMHLTDAGCDALWALQKADAVAQTYIGLDVASGPCKGVRVAFKGGQLIDFIETNGEPLTGTAHLVSFNNRYELREYMAGAKA